MAWILVGALLVSGAFFAMVLRQVMLAEERLRSVVVRNETRLSRRYRAKLVPPEGEAAEVAP